jgi:hypothetical protein
MLQNSSRKPYANMPLIRRAPYQFLAHWSRSTKMAMRSFDIGNEVPIRGLLVGSFSLPVNG